MPKPRKKSTDSSTVTESPKLLARLRNRLYRPMTLAAMAGVLALAVGWPIARRLAPDLRSRTEYRLPAAQIHVTQPPRWVPRDLVEQVVAQAELPEELPLLDDGLARDVADAFALHPWVENVVSVRKSFPATIDVQLVYRRPVAMVRVRNGSYPIDPRGVLLPPHDFSPADARSYPQVIGAVSTPQGPAGSPWGDPIVSEAAQLADELAPIWKKLHLTEIVCPRTAPRAEALDAGVFTLTTSGGSQIIWGHGPGSDHPGELSTQQKVERLEKYAARFGGLDQPQGRFRIDIRHWRDITRSPISVEGDGAAGQTR